MTQLEMDVEFIAGNNKVASLIIKVCNSLLLKDNLDNLHENLHCGYSLTNEKIFQPMEPYFVRPISENTGTHMYMYFSQTFDCLLHNFEGSNLCLSNSNTEIKHLLS